MNKPSLLLNSFLHSSIIINFTITFYDVYFPFVLPRRKIADSNFSRERKFGVEWGVRDDPTSHGCLAVSQSYSVYMPLGSRTAVTWVADRPPPTTWLILCAGRHHRRRAQTPGGRRDPRARAAPGVAAPGSDASGAEGGGRGLGGVLLRGPRAWSSAERCEE